MMADRVLEMRERAVVEKRRLDRRVADRGGTERVAIGGIAADLLPEAPVRQTLPSLLTALLLSAAPATLAAQGNPASAPDTAEGMSRATDTTSTITPGVNDPASTPDTAEGMSRATDTTSTITPGVRVAFRVEGPGAPEMRYHAAAIKPGSLAQDAPDGVLRTAALELLEFLGSERARRVFGAHGFLPLAGAS